MVDLKVGDRVYYSIYYDNGHFEDGPNTNQNIGRIETIEPFDDWYIISLENEKYVMVLYEFDDGRILKGEAIRNNTLPTDRKDVASAFITQSYMHYSRETVLFLKKTLANTPQYNTFWGSSQPNWEWAATLTHLKRFMKRLVGTDYEKMYPEDFI